MQIGIMAKTFARPTLEETVGAVAAHGIHCVQFGLTCAHVALVASNQWHNPDMPDHIAPSLCDRIRKALDTHKIAMSAISGTFNMADPDPQKRRQGLQRLRMLASVCHRLGTPVITLCTGTRDPGYMWRSHPDNDTPEAWKDMAASMREAVQIAEEHKVTLAFEPEVSNVVDSAAKGRRLLDEMRSPCLKVVMDPANIFHKGELPRMREIIAEAFALLGGDIALAHAKDLTRDGEAGHDAAGKGLLDYTQYLSLLHKAGPDTPLILHGLSESQVDGCVAFLRERIAVASKTP
jgi:sugar phosphate isomerase/epimerase